MSTSIFTASGGSICHTVTFRLRHEAGSAAERAFLTDAQRILSAIPGVDQFTQLRQVSDKSPLGFAFSMIFADRDAYRAYDEHPEHVAFVRDRWVAEVADFQELDFVAL